VTARLSGFWSFADNLRTGPARPAGLRDWVHRLFAWTSRGVVGVGSTAQMLGVLEHFIPVAIHAGIFPLGLHVGAADVDGAQLVGPNASVEYFLAARLGEKYLFANYG
jgi:hypothetical protein